MLGHVLVVLKDALNTYLGAKSGRQADDPAEAAVVFPDGEKMEPLVFQLGAITALLISVEEENVLRAANPYVSVGPNGAPQRVNPDVRLNLFVLFVAHYKRYEDGLRYLSWVIQFFQSHRRFDHRTAPSLSEEIDHLSIELVTLPFSEQNEVWNALRTTYHPSILYKVKMVVFRDEDAPALPEIAEKDIAISP